MTSAFDIVATSHSEAFYNVRSENLKVSNMYRSDNTSRPMSFIDKYYEKHKK